MLVGLYIFLDDEFDDPIYADPIPAELDEGLWEAICELANDAIDEEIGAEGARTRGDSIVAWRHIERVGITFVAVVSSDIRAAQVDAYLSNLSRRYLDEVDDARTPDKEGVEDVVVDVIPPWDED